MAIDLERAFEELRVRSREADNRLAEADKSRAEAIAAVKELRRDKGSLQLRSAKARSCAVRHVRLH